MPDDDDTLDPSNLETPPPAGTPPVVAPPAAAGTPPAAGAPAAPVPPAAATPPVRRSNALSDEEKARLADHKDREKRKLWREEFGTDDEAEVTRIRADRKKKLDEHAALVEAEAERKRASMSEVEQLQADKLRLEQELQEARTELTNLKKDNVAQQQDTRIHSIASNYIRPSRIKFAKQEFREYVLSLSDADKKRLDERRIGLWFTKFAKENPDMALEASTTPSAAGTPPSAIPPSAGTPPAGGVLQRRVVPAGARPITRPTVPNNPAPADPLAGKTPLPGKPNSMNKQELKEYAKRNHGLTLR